MKLPILPVEAMVTGLSDSDAWIVRAAFVRSGRLRTNKPFRRVTSHREGCANYVWRMLCFDYAGFGKHSCMPVCAEFELSDAIVAQQGYNACYGQAGYDVQRDREKALRAAMEALIKTAVSTLPIGAGTMLWARAFGIR